MTSCLTAGAFSEWLARTRLALATQGGADVPCGECTACCRSAYFIHIRPDETETLARIPKAVQFPAPDQPGGHVVLGFDESGHCPMLVDNACSIYEHRPVTCRSFDCRVFAAAGIAAGDADKTLVTEQTLRWTFDYPEENDRREHAAVQAASSFLRRHGDCFPTDATTNATQLALLAVNVHELFLDSGTRTDQQIVDAIKALLSTRSLENR
jgi:Fe-S-cluster containining protein